MNAPREESGVALVISLAFIVMLTVVVVGLMESMRTDRPAAGEYVERARAAQFAQSGVEQVIGTLQQLTADTNRNWISQPGQIVVGAAADNTNTAVDERKVLQYSVPLSSGAAGTLPPGGSASNAFFTSPNLNVPTLRDPTTYLIAETSNGSTPQLQVSWIYVKQDGTPSRTLQPNTASNPTAYQWTDNPNYASDTTPVVGRYAYWADDESSKINYNIAWGRDAASVAADIPAGSPTKIDLTALTGMTSTMADALHTYITNSNSTTLPYAFFNTPEDARKLNTQTNTAGISQVLQNNKFEVTHYSHDPNTTFFNEPRIVLTTHPDRAGWTLNTNSAYPNQWVGINGLPWPNGRPRYIRILNDPQDPNADPGQPYNNSIDSAKLYDTINTIAWNPVATGQTPGYLARTDWPMVSGTGSFQSKYYSAYPTSTSASGITAQESRLAEMAVNIIDYVRAKESSQPFIQPIIGYFDQTATTAAAAFVYDANAQAKNGYIGLTRMPCITEMGVWYGQNTTSNVIVPPNDGNKTVTTTPIAIGDMYFLFQFEIYLPRNYGLTSVDLSKFFLTIGPVAPSTSWNPNYPTYAGDSHQIDPSEVASGSTILTAGNYAVVSRAVRSTLKLTNPRPATTGAGFKVILEGSAYSTNYQIVPANNGLTNGLPINTDPTVLPAGITSLEVDDPRLNAHPGDWVQVTVNSFGKQNSRWSAGKSPPSTLPEVDTDNGVVSSASLYMPPPAGTKFQRSDGTYDDNSVTGSNGMVSSVAELGYVCTGFEPCAFFTSASGSVVAIPPGTPWRTLRLQPNKYPDTTVVPDWALMDLFTAPVKPPTQYNAYVYAPHTNGFGGRVNLNSTAVPFGLSRTIPLTAVLQNCTCDSTNLNSTVSPATAQTLANNIYNRTPASTLKWYGYQNAYCSPGEVAEIKGIADSGEKSEELMRQIANLVTTRGNVFSIYTIGQAIKQSPSGAYTVTGEQRLQAMVERYLNYNTTDPTKNEVRFAPVYYRNLTP